MIKRDRFYLRVFISLFAVMGCARVNLATKEPLQVDVKMRVDIYQHVAQDAASIEDMVTSEPRTTAFDSLSSLFGVREAWAEKGDYPPHVLDAIKRRKARRDQLGVLEQRGTLGENRRGLVELIDPAVSDKDVLALVRDENQDRSIIYQYVARKNSASVEETERIFAQKIQARAPEGTPVQSASGEWMVK